uniref:Uncharacterized protein n=1 Tax=viral metagenome TaxID=1070528 RepID=A0A6C0IN28_9ZZZZ
MKKGSASDYITAKKQNAIYVGIKTDAQLTGTTVNPLKKNGYYYNNNLNVCVPKDCNLTSCNGGVLTNAKSYQLRLDFKRGKYYNNYVCNCPNNIIYDVIDDINTEPCIGVPINGPNVINCLCTTCAFNTPIVNV